MININKELNDYFLNELSRIRIKIVLILMEDLFLAKESLAEKLNLDIRKLNKHLESIYTSGFILLWRDGKGKSYISVSDKCYNYEICRDKCKKFEKQEVEGKVAYYCKRTKCRYQGALQFKSLIKFVESGGYKQVGSVKDNIPKKGKVYKDEEEDCYKPIEKWTVGDYYRLYKMLYKLSFTDLPPSFTEIRKNLSECMEIFRGGLGNRNWRLLLKRYLNDIITNKEKYKVHKLNHYWPNNTKAINAFLEEKGKKLINLYKCCKYGLTCSYADENENCNIESAGCSENIRNKMRELYN